MILYRRHKHLQMAQWLRGDFSSDQAGRSYKPLPTMISLNAMSGEEGGGGGGGGDTVVNSGYEEAPSDTGGGGFGGGGAGGGGGSDLPIIQSFASDDDDDDDGAALLAPVQKLKAKPKAKSQPKKKGGSKKATNAANEHLPLAAQIYEEERAQYIADASDA